MSNISQWNIAAASNNSAAPDGYPEGMPASGLNDASREVMAAVARWYSDTDGTLVTAGAGNAYTLSSNSSFTLHADISYLAFRVDRANTGTATLAVDGLGARTLRSAGSALISGQLVADSIITVSYNSTDDVFDIHSVIKIDAADLIGELADARLSANVPRKDARVIFTATFSQPDFAVNVAAAIPGYLLRETDAASDNQNWAMLANSGQLQFSAYNDAGSVGTDWLAVDRTGTTVDLIALAATSITANGSEVLTPAEVAAATAIEGNALVGSDGFYVDDAGVAKRMSYQSAGLRVQTVTGTTDTLADDDMNSYIITTNAAAVTITINTGVGVQGNVLLIKQGGTGQVSLAGTATFESAVGTKTNKQNSVIALVNEGSDVWSVSGDAST